MKEYEVLLEESNPCGGDNHSKKEFIEVECESPESYVRQFGRFPIVDIIEMQNGDTVINTSDVAGNKIRYTFTEI